MKMEFTFDKMAVEKKGYTLPSVYDTIKNEFDKYNLLCVSDDEVLAFSGSGDKNDYANMLTMMWLLSKTDWFLPIASSWIFREDEDKWEDVLSQAKGA